MPEPSFDFTELMRLKDVPEMLRQMGVQYQGLRPPPTVNPTYASPGLQEFLARSAPVGIPAAAGAGTGLGLLGMLAALLTVGGSTDPNIRSQLPEEEKFRQWYGAWANRTGLNPNPDDPRHFYDYRAAFRAGQEPQQDPATGEWHWPSTFKAPEHPNRYVEGVDTITGQEMPYYEAENTMPRPFESKKKPLSFIEPPSEYLPPKRGAPSGRVGGASR